MTNKVDYLAVTQENDEGEFDLYYYVRFSDGRSYWSFPRGSDGDELSKFIKDNGVKQLSLGLDEDGDLQYAIEGEDGALLWCLDVHRSWLEDGWDECFLGNKGEYFVRGGESFIHSHLPTSFYREVKKYGKRVKRMFVSNGDFLFTYS